MRHYSEKLYMLKLINKETGQGRSASGYIGKQLRRQLHAESSLRNCAGSHWALTAETLHAL